MDTGLKAALDGGGREATARFQARRKLWRPVRDALAAGALFSVIAAPLMCHPLSASPIGGGAIMAVEAPPPLVAKALAEDERAPIVQIATSSAPGAPNTVYKRTSSQAAWLLLSLAFSLLAALNLAMVRHLREAYAQPMKRVERQRSSARRVVL